MPAAPGWAGAIDAGFLEQPWPRERSRETEVGRYAVTWRESASKRDGIYAGVRFAAPLSRQAVWDLANEYQDVGAMTPGVTAVREVERSERREVIEVDVKVLWKSLTLRFEVEKDPPSVMRFRLVNEALGEYRGLSRFAPGEAGQTTVDLLTWLKPSRPVPIRLLLVVERVAMLQASREFLKRCDERLKRAAGPAAAPPMSVLGREANWGAKPGLRAAMGPGSASPAARSGPG